MRKSNTQKIGEVVKEYLDEMKLSQKLKEVSIVKSWEELMGKAVANRTKSIYIKNKVLHIHLNSSVLRGELIRMRQSIIDRINEKAGEQIIEKIVLK